MFCKYCGTQLKDGTRFCVKCGKEVTMPQGQGGGQASMPQRQSGGQASMPQGQGGGQASMPQGQAGADTEKKKASGNRKLVGVLCGVFALIALAAVGEMFFLFHKKSGSDYQQPTLVDEANLEETVVSEKKETENESVAQDGADTAQASEAGDTAAEEDDAADTAADADAGDDAADTAVDADAGDDAADAQEDESYMDAFYIYPDTTEDYAANLNPGTYHYYDSGIDSFNFYYPDLYNKVEVATDPFRDAYGNNVQAVYFSGNSGSEADFKVMERTDGMDTGTLAEQIYNTETGKLTDAVKLKDSVDGDSALVIVTGYTGDRSGLVYDMTRVMGNYVMQMRILFPSYVSTEDELQKGYVTECMYRMCGFSGSSNWYRSFEEYREAYE